MAALNKYVVFFLTVFLLVFVSDIKAHVNFQQSYHKQFVIDVVKTCLALDSESEPIKLNDIIAGLSK